MNANLGVALLALALTAGAVPGEASAGRGPVLDAQAQSAVPPGAAEPCEPSAKPLSPSGQSGCRSSGVIRPPVTGDRGVLKPPETTGAMPMPVIPPPGSPGRSPGVQPK